MFANLSLKTSHLKRLANQLLLRKSLKTSSCSKMPLPPVLEARRPKESPEFDYSTLSNYKSFKVDQSSLDVHIDFAKSVISGTVSYEIGKLKQNERFIKLDTSFLEVFSVKINDNENVDFEIVERKEPLGSQLIVKPSDLPES